MLRKTCDCRNPKGERGGEGGRWEREGRGGREVGERGEGRGGRWGREGRAGRECVLSMVVNSNIECRRPLRCRVVCTVDIWTLCYSNNVGNLDQAMTL